MKHVEEIHGNQEEEDTTCERSSKDVSEFELEFTPKKVKKESQDGINIKGDSDEFKEASDNLLKMMEKKGKQYTIEGREMYIKSVRRTSPSAVTIDVEVTSKNGKAGVASLVIYSKGSMRITKKKGEDAIFVKTLAEKIIKPLLKKFITRDLAESKLKVLEINPLNKTVKGDNPCRCHICNQVFASKHGVAIHMNVHKPRKINAKKKFSLNVLPNDPMKKCECQQCGKVFKSETDLKDHELNQHKVFPRTPKPQTRKDDVVEKCNVCNKTFTKEKKYREGL